MMVNQHSLFTLNVAPNSGELGLQSLKNIPISMQNPNFSPNETLRPLFNSVDTDKSGKITFNELQKVLTMPGSEINSVFSERCKCCI